MVIKYKWKINYNPIVKQHIGMQAKGSWQIYADPSFIWEETVTDIFVAVKQHQLNLPSKDIFIHQKFCLKNPSANTNLNSI